MIYLAKFKITMKKFVTFIFLILLSCSKDSQTPIEQLTYALTVSASEGGLVDNTGGICNENIDVIITATPAAGFTLTGWSGSADGTTNPLTISMNGDKNIIATFFRSQYAFTMVVSGQGSVSHELFSSAKSKTDYESGSTIRLTANSEPGGYFIIGKVYQEVLSMLQLVRKKHH